MPRPSSDQTQERHAFLLDLFRQQPEIGSKEALASFKEKFGGTISPKILNELREQALGDTQAAAEEPSAPELPLESAAARLQSAASAPDANGAAQPAKKPKSKGGPRNVFIDASQEQLAFLERVLQQLQEAGATNVRIDHSTDRWMVIAVESK